MHYMVARVLIAATAVMLATATRGFAQDRSAGAPLAERTAPTTPAASPPERASPATNPASERVVPERIEKRVALVVGNSKYVAGGVLRNPASDAGAIQAPLVRLGFEVIVGLDLSLASFREKKYEFATRIKEADIALLFYAGHGLQHGEQNYLLPIDFDVRSEVEIAYRSIALNELLEIMGKHARTSIVFLDACREIPQFRGTDARGPQFARGLAKINIPLTDHFIGFAAGPGKLAEDGRGKNSPFTESLIRHIDRTDEVQQMFTQVRNEVSRKTQNRQMPESHVALSSRVSLNTGILPPPEPEGPPDPSISLSAEAEFWLIIKDGTDPRQFEAYLQQYPGGRFATIAKKKIEQLQKAEQAKADQLKAEALRAEQLARLEAIKPAGKATALRPGAAVVVQPGLVAQEVRPTESDVVVAMGVAQTSKQHPREEAARSARAHARAKAILIKVGGGQPLEHAGSSGDAADALIQLGRGLTYEEAWTTSQTLGRQVKTELRAKVRVLGAEGSRRLAGVIEPAEVIAGQSIRFNIKASKEATLGIFAWQANETVVRLYPVSTKQLVTLKAGEAVSFPRASDPYPAIAVANLPNERSNHEAIIVVTGSTSIAYDQIVPFSIANAPQTASTVVEGTEFLAKLAAIQDPELEVLVLPYVVRAER